MIHFKKTAALEEISLEMIFPLFVYSHHCLVGILSSYIVSSPLQMVSIQLPQCADVPKVKGKLSAFLTVPTPPEARRLPAAADYASVYEQRFCERTGEKRKRQKERERRRKGGREKSQEKS